MNPIMCERLVIDTLARRDTWARFVRHGGADLDPDVVLQRWAHASQSGVLCANVSRDTHLRVRLRPSSDAPLFNGQTPGLLAYRKQARLVVNGLEWVAPLPAQTYERTLRGPLYLNAPLYMHTSDFDAIGRLPRRRVEQSERLAQWQDYLEWRAQLVHHHRAGVRYLAMRWDGDTLVFRIHPEETCPDLEEFVCQPVGASADPERWRPADPNRVPRDISVPGRIIERRVGAEGSEEVVFGFSKTVLADLREARWSPPREGFLLANIVAERVQIQTQQRALRSLKSDQGYHPALLPRLFGHQPYPASRPLPLAPDDPIVAHLTPDQRDAAARLAGADPLVLIQGPPGTGKTTTIVAATRLIINRGGSVLVASQSNLAVDNVLERLPRDPAVRPIRLVRDADKVEPTVAPMVVGSVVEAHWLPVVREAVEARGRFVADDLAAEADRATARCEALDVGDAADRLQVGRAARAREIEQLRDAEIAGRAALQAARVEVDALDAAQAAIARILAGEVVLAPPAATRCYALLDAAMVEQALAVRAVDGLDARRAAICGLCAGESAPDDAQIARLQRQRENLARSTDPAELTQLIAVNQELARLQGSAWAAQTRWVQALCARVPDLPGVALTDALRPTRDLLPAADAFFAALDARIGAVEALMATLRAGAEEDAADLVNRRRAADDAARQRAAALAEVTDRRTRTEEALLAMDRAFGALEVRWRTLAPRAGIAVKAPSGSAARAAGPTETVDVPRAEAWQRIRAALVGKLNAGGAHASLSERYLRMPNVVGATCHEAAKLFNKRSFPWLPFDIAIVDEVSKATAPELVQPALTAKRVGFIGDPNQLQPVFRNRPEGYREAIAEGLIAEEDFERFRGLVTAGLFTELFHAAPEHAKTTLTTQFRAHPDIMEGFNVFYGGALEAGPGTELRGHGLTIADREGGQLVGPEQRFLWIDSAADARGRPAFERQVGSSKSNPLESALLVDLLVRIGKALRGRGLTGETVTWTAGDAPLAALVAQKLPQVEPEERDRLIRARRVTVDGRPMTDGEAYIGADRTLAVDLRRGAGLIALYGAQVRLLRRDIDKARRRAGAALSTLDLRVASVDRFQGGEASIVLVSLVRAPERGGIGAFARDFRRINVGLSRARDLLVVAGSREALRGVTVGIPGGTGPVQAYRRVMDHVDTIGGRRDAARLLA